MQFAEGEISQVVEQYFSNILGVSVRQTSKIIDQNTPSEIFFSSVGIEGENWKGSVKIEVSENFAKNISSKLLLKDQNKLAIEEIKDVLGELTNVLGGGIKPTLPEPCSLLLPEFGKQLRFNQVDGKFLLITSLNMEILGEPFVISLFEKEGENISKEDQ